MTFCLENLWALPCSRWRSPRRLSWPPGSTLLVRFCARAGRRAHQPWRRRRARRCYGLARCRAASSAAAGSSLSRARVHRHHRDESAGEPGRRTLQSATDPGADRAAVAAVARGHAGARVSRCSAWRCHRGQPPSARRRPRARSRSCCRAGLATASGAPAALSPAQPAHRASAATSDALAADRSGARPRGPSRCGASAGCRSASAASQNRTAEERTAARPAGPVAGPHGRHCSRVAVRTELRGLPGRGHHTLRFYYASVRRVLH
jgi:hypothetical protein